ncbi:type IV pilin protein [Luteibacter sp. Lutesp34]|uniref:type IV pilin protein n=1 Tax=Luteibacter sp. Lutesp34 TaxID=3243030 RepID=UPI0039B48E17
MIGRTQQRQSRGFTLIELVIVVLIVAILAAVAIPSYRKYIIRSHRVDAQAALIDVAAREERYFYSKNAYTDSLDDLNASKTMAGDRYEIGVAVATSTAFRVEAKALSDQAAHDPECQTLTLNNLGAQGSTGTKTNDPVCWSK